MEINNVVNKVLEAPGIRVIYKFADRDTKLQMQAKLTTELVKLVKENPEITEEEAAELFTVMFLALIQG